MLLFRNDGKLLFNESLYEKVFEWYMIAKTFAWIWGSKLDKALVQVVGYFEVSFAAKVMGHSKKVIGYEESVSVIMRKKTKNERKSVPQTFQ